MALMLAEIGSVLIQELQEFQPFYLMKWVLTKLNNTFHQESWSKHFAWNSNTTVYSSHCTIVLNQTCRSLTLVFLLRLVEHPLRLKQLYGCLFQPLYT